MVSSIVVAGLLSLGPTSILAQITAGAVCLSSFSWMFNSLGQSPCLVTAYLGGACNGGTYNVYELPAGFHYTGPFANQQNPCQCSSVLYNAISACSLCQNTTIINWSQWNFNCSTVYPGVFAPGIPSGTVVPQWAFQDVTTSNLFNVTFAQAVGDTPESTATLVQSTGSLSATSAASLTSPPQSTTATPGPASSGGSDTAAIAGGVVGGVIGLLIIGVIAFFILKKLHAPPPPLTEHKDAVPEPTSPVPAIYTDGAPFGLPEIDKA